MKKNKKKNSLVDEKIKYKELIESFTFLRYLLGGLVLVGFGSYITLLFTDTEIAIWLMVGIMGFILLYIMCVFALSSYRQELNKIDNKLTKRFIEKVKKESEDIENEIHKNKRGNIRKPIY